MVHYFIRYIVYIILLLLISLLGEIPLIFVGILFVISEIEYQFNELKKDTKQGKLK